MNYDVEFWVIYNRNLCYDPTERPHSHLIPIGLAGGINTYGYVGEPLT